MADIYEIDSATRKLRIAQLAKTFEMENALNDKILSYSHGMRQKIVIMGVLISDPNVWILDEPCSGSLNTTFSTSSKISSWSGSW